MERSTFHLVFVLMVLIERVMGINSYVWIQATHLLPYIRIYQLASILAWSSTDIIEEYNNTAKWTQHTRILIVG